MDRTWSVCSPTRSPNALLRDIDVSHVGWHAGRGRGRGAGRGAASLAAGGSVLAPTPNDPSTVTSIFLSAAGEPLKDEYDPGRPNDYTRIIEERELARKEVRGHRMQTRLNINRLTLSPRQVDLKPGRP